MSNPWEDAGKSRITVMQKVWMGCTRIFARSSFAQVIVVCFLEELMVIMATIIGAIIIRMAVVNARRA